jgi:hypothetical protein
MLDVIWKRHSLICLSVALSLSSAFGQDADISRPYFFSGPCASQGVWTQQALNHTNRIRQVAIQLEKDPNCKATASSMQDLLRGMDENLKNAEMGGSGSSQQTLGKLNSLPQEIGALRSFMADSPGGVKTGLLQTMMQKAVEFSTLTAEVGGQSSASAIGTATNPQAALLLSLEKRMQVATTTGLKIFNGVIDTVAADKQCLTGSQGGQFLSAAAATLASFAASGQSQIGNDLATAVSKVGRLGRDLKFSKVFKTLNKIEFMNSMSCLTEITSESYCSARDGLYLYQEMNKQMKQDAIDRQNKIKAGKDPSAPLAGYYILTQQLPLITNWLQRVQIGVDPKLSTDATFQIKILDNVNLFFISVKRLQGLFNEQVTFIRGLKDPVAKKFKLIELVTALDSALTGGVQNASSEFFTASVQAIEIPFRLLGIAVPPEMFGANSTMTFDRWIQNSSNYASIPNSSNPDVLADSVGQNLDRIVEAAKESAVVYYNRFFVVDKASIALDALLGTNYTIKESLIAIDQYLGRLQKRISNGKGEQGFIPSIIETRAKIGRIMAKFRDIQQVAEEMKNAPKKLPVALIEKARKVHADFVNEVYVQFEVLLGKSGWLANRLSRIVYYDYSMMLRNGLDLSPYFKELYYVTGFAAYDKMVAMANGGPGIVESDLKSALRANIDNISALEILFKDNLVAMIREQKLIADQTTKAIKECGGLIPKNKPFESLNKKTQDNLTSEVAGCMKRYEITPSKVLKDAYKSSFNEGYQSMPGESTSQIFRLPRGLWTALKGQWEMEPKYSTPGLLKSLFNPNREKISFDDEGGSSRYLTARMCVQALAFNDLKSFWHLCKDTTLESDFNLPLETTQFKNVKPDYFQVNFKNKAYESVDRPDLNHSKRICAFRDFFRRNQVLYLTMGMQKIGDIQKDYEPEYTIEEDVAPPPPAPTPVNDSQEKNPIDELSPSDAIPRP